MRVRTATAALALATTAVLGGASVAAADGGVAFDNDQYGDAVNTLTNATQGAFGQGSTYGAEANGVSNDSAGAGLLDD